jgi:ParB family chromosome partitioning protein
MQSSTIGLLLSLTNWHAAVNKKYMSEPVVEIYTDKINDPKDPMRSDLDRAGLFELSDNIKQNGLINPITVRPVGDMYEVVAGHRRLSACKIAGLLKIQCIVRTLSDAQAFEVMAAENLERADVDPVDEAIFITRFMAQSGKSPAEVSKALRRSVQWVETRIVVGLMPDYMKAHLKVGDLKLGAALALVQIEDDAIRRVWVEMAVRDGVSVAQAEYWLHGWRVSRLPGGSGDTNPPADWSPAAAGPVMFRCAIDDKEYDARTFKSVMIQEANMPIFFEFVKLFRASAPSTVSTPAETPPPPPPPPNAVADVSP